jgi:hypothetical protein
MLVHIKEISKKKNKTDFSQHSCTNVFTAVADLQVQSATAVKTLVQECCEKSVLFFFECGTDSV